MRKAKFSKTVSIPIAEAVFQALKHISDLQEISISELIRSILDKYLIETGRA